MTSTSHVRALALFFVATGPLLALPQAQGNSTAQLLSTVEKVPAQALAWDKKEKLLDAAIVRSTFVRLDTRALERIRASNESPLATFGLDLFGTPHLLDIDGMQTVLGYRLYTGRVRGRSGEVSLVVAGDGVSSGTIHLIEESYVLAYAAHGDIHVLQEMDESRRALGCGVGPKAEQVKAAATGSGAGALAPENCGNTIMDVMVFYTQKARQAAGGKTAMEAQIVGAISQANWTSLGSFVAADFRLVYMAETNYVEDGSTSDLGRFRSTTDGYMDEVHALRDTYGGDLMHLITEPATAQYCGVAYLMTQLSTTFQSASFGVTLRQCMNGNVVAHEMGHNIGCHHDRSNASSAIYPHAYGFRTADQKYRTVMAYSPGTRVNVWSSPSVRYQSYVMGQANSEDNALTITKTMTTVSQFKATKTLVWCELKGGISGQLGLPTQTGAGTINRVRPITITIEKYRANANGLLVFGGKDVSVPFLGGTLVPSVDIPVPVTGNGAKIVFDANALSQVSPGTPVWFQSFFLDQSAVQGVSASNATKVVIP